MRIEVIYFDNNPGFVKPEELDDLIKSRRILAFRRSGGWVRVGRDPVREGRGNYNGPERRKQ